MVNSLKIWLEQLVKKAKELQVQNEQQHHQLLGERVAFEAVLFKLKELEHESEGASEPPAVNSDQPASAQEGAATQEGTDVRGVS